MSKFAEASTVAELTDIDFLSRLVGPIRKMERLPLKTVGFSGTLHERLQIELANGKSCSLILKNIYSEQDLSVWRTGNVTGREARLLRERRLDHIWNIFQPPFLGYAFEDQFSGLLMIDLTDSLFPDVREPLQIKEEESLIAALAKLHVANWENTTISQIPWLGKDRTYFSFLAPNALLEEKLRGRSSPVFEAAEGGWQHIQKIVPEYLWEFLNKPAEELHKITHGLPKTLLHGDSKVANFAIDSRERVNAFDWSMIAFGCSACEIGWYVTVNATRLTRPKEDIFLFYRTELEQKLGLQFSNADWRRMEATAIVTGAMTLLWSKGLNLQKGLPGSLKEWNWWIARIEQVRNEYFS